jgi:uncharacterized delta-60 repeat protein
MSFLFYVRKTLSNYQLSSTLNTVAEGNSFTVTLTTSGVLEGTLVPYTITGVSANDIDVPLTGSFTVGGDGTATLVVTPVNDFVAEGDEIFTITLDEFPAVTLPVTIEDGLTGDYWIVSIGGEGSDVLSGVAVDGSGNIFTCGISSSFGDGTNDIILIKQNSSGTVLWGRRIGIVGLTDTGYSVAVDSAGNPHIAGISSSGGAGAADMLVVKYNTNGTLLWQRALGGVGTDNGHAIAVDSSGNVYVTGTTLNQGAGGSDVLIAKYNSSGTLLWQRALGGSSNDIGRGIAVDSSGNAYVLGSTNSQGAGGADILIVKYNTSGTLQWQRTLGGVSSDNGNGIAVDSSGNVYITGNTASSGEGLADAVVAKYNTTGTLLWQRTIGGTGNENGFGIAVDGLGDAYILGTTNSQAVGSADFLVAKFSTTGDLIWQRALGTTSTDSSDFGGCIAITGSKIIIAGDNGSPTTALVIALPIDGSGTGTFGDWTYQDTTLVSSPSSLTSNTSTLTGINTTLTQTTTSIEETSIPFDSSTGVLYRVKTLSGTSSAGGAGPCIAKDSSNNIYIVASISGVGAGGNDLFVAKYNSGGSLIWQRALGGASTEAGYAIGVDILGNVYATGFTQSSGAGSHDVLVVKYNTNGVFQWQRTLGGTGSDYGYGLAVESSTGDVYLCGPAQSQSAGSFDFLTVKYNTSGTLVWQRRLGGTGVDFPSAIAVDSSGNCFSVGYTGSQGAGGDDVLIAKYNTSGTLQWQRTLGGVSSDLGRGVATDGSGSIYIIGSTSSAGAGSSDLLLAKYDTNGTLLWQRALGSAAAETGNGIAIDGNVGVYVVGTSTVARYSTAGTFSWQKNIPFQPISIALAGEYIVGRQGDSTRWMHFKWLAALPDQTFTNTTTSLTSSTSTLTAATTTLTSSASGLTQTTTTLTDTLVTEELGNIGLTTDKIVIG